MTQFALKPDATDPDPDGFDVPNDYDPELDDENETTDAADDPTEGVEVAVAAEEGASLEEGFDLPGIRTDSAFLGSNETETDAAEPAEKPVIRELTPKEAQSHPLNPRSVSAILQHAMPISDDERDYQIAEAQKVAAFRPVEYAFLTNDLKKDIAALSNVTRKAVNALADRHQSFFGEILWYIGRERYDAVRYATEEWVSGKRIFEAYADAMNAYKEPVEILEDIRRLCENYLKVTESPLPLADMQKFCLLCTEIAEMALAVKDFRTQMCVNALSTDHPVVVYHVLQLIMPKPPREALRQSPYFRIASRWRPSTEPTPDVLGRIRKALLIEEESKEAAHHG